MLKRDSATKADLLGHLAEIDERELHLELGYSSLFKYCVEGFGMSEPSAGRCIAAARVGRRFPQVFELMASGALHQSALCALSPHLDESNAAELFEACSGKGVRQIAELLAARFPKPDLADSVVALSVGTIGGDSTVAPLSADRFGVQFTADGEFRELLEAVKALARHRNPEGDLLKLMRAGLEAYRRELEKERFGIGRRERSREANAKQADVASANEQTKKRRRARAAVTRAIYVRDDRCCSFIGRDGRRCGERAFVEIEHVRAHALGGGETVGNLELLCRAHNQWRARRLFGRRFMRGAVARARARKEAKFSGGERAESAPERR